MSTAATLEGVEEFSRYLEEAGATGRRLADRLRPEGACIVWLGARTTAGYGELRVDGKVRGVHRLVWEIFNGPTDLCVLHRCDNPPCANPEHLFVGTHQDNVDDKMAKGRHRHGHLYGDDHPLRRDPSLAVRGEKSGQAKLTDDAVREIRARLAAGDTPTEIAKDYGVTRSPIEQINRNETWRHVT